MFSSSIRAGKAYVTREDLMSAATIVQHMQPSLLVRALGDTFDLLANHIDPPQSVTPHEIAPSPTRYDLAESKIFPLPNFME